MARKKKSLGSYVAECREKYKHPYRLLFHVSLAPRKVLSPRRTTFQVPSDDDRQHPLLFLCPLRDVKEWLGWYLTKFPASRKKEVDRVLNKRGHLVLYVHVVRVNPDELVIPRIRYYQEFATRNAHRPEAIIPIKLTYGKPLNLSRVASKVEQVKARQVRSTRKGEQN
jgi:hypothetical protein